MIGPGKYDDVATTVRERTQAEGVIVIILGGDKGHGFSVQADLITTLGLPKMLRLIADQIEQDLAVQALAERMARDPECDPD